MASATTDTNPTHTAAAGVVGMFASRGPVLLAGLMAPAPKRPRTH